MAALAADSMRERPITAIVASPLERTQESAAPWAKNFGLEVRLEPEVIEPHNRFEGSRMTRGTIARNWPHLLNPWRPSWGEAFTSISRRMLAALDAAHAATESGELVVVSHQLPIWMVHRTLAGKRLAHDPRQRRCSLSSITTIAKRGDRFVEVDYVEPAAELLAESIDLGAV